MTHHITTLAAALFTLAAATGCNQVHEFDCATLQECGIDWQLDPGFSPAFVDDTSVELASAPEFDHAFMTVAVKHPAQCAAPELQLYVQGIGRSLPATALASIEIFAGTCDARTVRDATPSDATRGDTTLSNLRLDLSEALPHGVCVGHVLLDLPGFAGADAGPMRITLDEAVCGKGSPAANPNLNAHG